MRSQTRLGTRWLAASLAFALTWFHVVPPAFAAQFRVFRKTYIRDADAPDTVTNPFGVLNPQTSWTLRAVNGNLEDTSVEKVSSSTVKLNGLDVLQPSHFSQNVNLVEVPITVGFSNTVATQLRSKPGGQLTVEIVGQDEVPPVAIWVSPQAAQLFNTETVAARLHLADDVAGLDPSSLRILLNGVSALPPFPALTQPTLQATLDANLVVADGVHTLSAEVRDLAGQPASASVSFTVDRTPPSLDITQPTEGATIPTSSVDVRITYDDTVSGVDTASLAILLNGADVATQFAVGPSSAEATLALDSGSYDLTVMIRDRAGHQAALTRHFMVETGPVIPTGAGFLHGLVLQAGSEQSLADAVITVEGLASSVRSGADGSYSVPVPGTGVFDLNIQKPSFTSVQRRAEVFSGRDASVAPALLTPLDLQVTPISQAAGGLASDSSGDFQVIFPPGAAPYDLQVRVTPLMEDAQLPGPIPEDMAHVGAVYFEPRFTTFNQPVTFRTRNRMGLPAGTSVILTLWDEDTQQWMDAGTGLVTPDGSWVEFPIVRFFCWYCFRLPRTLPPQAESPDREDVQTATAEVQDPQRKCEVEGSSTVCPDAGDLAIEHALPPLQTLGHRRGLNFTYHSTTADPSMLVGTDYLLETASRPGDAGTLVPLTTSATIQIEGRRIDASFVGTAGRTRQAFLWDARNARGQLVPPGAYPYTIELSNEYQSTFGTTGLPTGDFASLTTTVPGRAVILNQRDSPFGAGWGLNGLQRLWPQPDGTVLVTDGDGSATVFRPGPMADLVIANFFSNDVSVLFGHGDGTLQPQQRFIVGPVPPVASDGLPNGVAVGEFNGDDFQDVAVTLVRTGQVAIVLGRGGAFHAPQHLAVGQSPGFVTTGDVNGDGLQDLITANAGSDDLSLLLGNGDGTFQPERRISVGQNPTALAIGDWNRDGSADVATANGGELTPFGVVGSDLSLIFGNGDGTFQPEQRLAAGRGPRAILGEDVNGDNVRDLIVANAFDNDLSLLLGNGDGTFQPQQRFPGVPSSFNGIAALAIGDFNGDGKRDLIETGLDTANVALLLGNGDGTFQPRRLIPSGGPPFSIAVVDLNRDGAQDLALTNGAFDSSVMLGNGDGTFQRPLRFQVGASPAGIAIGEFNDRLGDPNQMFTGLPGDFSQLARHPDGTFARRLTDGTRIEFDARGFHTRTVDRNGNETRYTYDAQDRLSHVEFPGGAAFDVAYNPANGHAASVTDSSGRTTQVLVDGEGNLRRLTNPDGTIRQFTYDSEHRLSAQVSERGFTTDYTYDAFGRLAEAVLPERPTFDPAIGTVSPQREARRFSPSETQGLINALPAGVGTPENPASAVVTPLATFQDPLGNTTQLSTDHFGAPTKLIDPLGRTTTMTRDVNGLPVAVTRPNGNVVQFTYDANGNLRTIREQRDVFTAPQITTFEYEPTFNHVTKIIDARRDSPFDFNHPCETGCTTRIEYDTNGNPLRIIDHANQATAFTYDGRGLVQTATDALGTATPAIPDDHQVHFTYDPLSGNLLTTTDPLNHMTALTYDAAGNVETSRDAAMRITTFTYDSMNRLRSVRDPLNQTTAYEYDAAGNLIRVTDAKSQQTQFAYDALSLLTSTTNPLAQIKQFFYDLNRNLAQVLDAKGQTVTFGYDAANQPIQKVLKDALGAVQDTMTYAYNSLGDLTLVQDGDSKLVFEYDSLGRPIQATTGDAAAPAAFAQPVTTLQYSYNANSNRTSATGATAVGLTYTYDGLNRVTGVTNGQFGSGTFTYDALGRVTRLQNGTTRTFSYDDASQLLNLNTTLSGNPLESFGYIYDGVGNRTSLMDRFGSHLYGYDALNRLTGADHPLASGLTDEAFTYDPVGNRTTSHRSALQVHDVANRLLEDATFTYTYDANGNLTTKTDKLTSALTTYTYDVDNQLTQIDLPGGGLAQYRYDGLGRRIEKTVNGTAMRFVYDQEDLVSVYTATGCWQASFTHGPGIDQPLAFMHDDSGNCGPSDAAGFREQVRSLQTDGLGSVTSLVSETSGFFRALNLKERYTYDSFGLPRITGPGPDTLMDTADDVTLTQSAFGNPYFFTGREYDPESGLYYYRARYYDPRTGRFLQEDPGYLINDAISLYGYVRNNPINYIDQFGRDSYYVNNKFNSSEPTDELLSHSFAVTTDRDPETGKEMVTDAFSWVDTGGGMWEDPQKKQNIEGAQKAIDSGVGATKISGEELDPYVEEAFEEKRAQHGGFWWNPSKGMCKMQAGNLLGRAKKLKRSEERRRSRRK